jgi:type I restriction enzyme S subunit
MIAHLKPYPKMKDSGVPWLGEVPEHWEVQKLRALLDRVTERNRPDLPLLSVVREKGVIRRDITSKDDNYNFIPDDLSHYKVVRSGQFAMNKMKAWQGSYGISQHDGIVSPAYFVFDLRGVVDRFFHSAVRSRAYVPFFTQASDGVRIGQWDLAQTRMNEIPFFIPHLTEQTAIVRFLGYMDRRIRKYIRIKQKLIKLLEEQKQAIIHRAVTRGLDPNVHLKPSGVEWMGEVPRHWEVRKLRSLFRRYGSGTTPAGDDYFGGDVPWVMTGDLKDRVLTNTKRTITSKALDEVRALRMYPAGSLLVAMYGATIGKTGILSMEACTNQACCVLADPREDGNVVYLQAVVNIARPQLLQQSYGGGQPNINAEIVRALRIPVPPRPEQDSIVTVLGERTQRLDEAIDRAQHEISLLREYRIRLIADVVTGKLDVREAEARLPDEAEEAEALDEIEAVENGEEMMDEGDGTSNLQEVEG